jgi:hypothetical protein
MFEQNLIIVSLFLGTLVLVWAIIKLLVAKFSAFKGTINAGSCLSLKDKIALEPGVNVYVVALENSEIVVTVNSRKFGSAQAKVLSVTGGLGVGDENA